MGACEGVGDDNDTEWEDSGTQPARGEGRGAVGGGLGGG
jgi:hypothetical protein